jgi:hypothetical protein
MNRRRLSDRPLPVQVDPAVERRNTFDRVLAEIYPSPDRPAGRISEGAWSALGERDRALFAPYAPHKETK